ncbi:twin-arginine translocation signal domain-containing protein [Agaribacter flavus]|uniref:Twin-arginine translocation signal domain-containing protein n=1 Tax=Agaribacter flavus TaxID=1902781 RepID=A0ABV7FT13_9ALTE
MNQEKDVTDKIGSTRRTFLKRSAAGATLATIPAKSVWATGITNSIVASGHGSDFAGGVPLKLQRPWYWQNRQGSIQASLLDSSFSTVFGGQPFADNMGTALKKRGTGEDLTVRDVIVGIGSGNNNWVYRGPANVNGLLISAYLSAVYTGVPMFDVNFPVVGPNKPFQMNEVLAMKLYQMAQPNPQLMGQELAQLHDNPTTFRP